MHLYPKRAVLDGAGAEIFKLLSYGATPEQWANWLLAPLEHAAARGNLDLVNRLLDAGASGRAGWRGCRGRTMIDAAALGGNPDVMSALLQAGFRPDVNIVSVSSKRSALHLAVVCGHEAVAKQLILAGANVHVVDPGDAAGPLHIAVRGGHGELVRDLLVRGASPGALDRKGLTPLHVAASLGHKDIVSSLLISSVTGKNAVDNAGFTPLMLASEEGHFSTVETLLAVGVDPTLRGKNDFSALDLAAYFGHVSTLKALLGHGVNVSARDGAGFTALHEAAQSDQAGAVNVLLDAGADVNAKTLPGSTPLLWAASCSCLSSALALLRRGANVDESTHEKETPLHMVCRQQRKGAAAAVDLLLRWGASERAIDEDGNTPADCLDNYADDRLCSAAEAQHVRTLLARAPIDSTWRRRCWAVMLRSRAFRETAAHRGGESDSEREEGGRKRLGGGESRGTNKVCRSGHGGLGDRPKHARQQLFGSSKAIGGEEDWTGVARMLVGLEPEGVFRTIIKFL